ncbi:MAG: M23 family metallopeptidase [Alphaproteobacteria bacterium]|nr:M23 family metallopeptidase [Alphaproteobacteria bacterium]
MNTTTRQDRAGRWRFALVSLTAVSLLAMPVAEALAQATKPPAKPQTQSRKAQQPQTDVQSFSLNPDTDVAQQLIALKVAEADAKAAAEALAQAMTRSDMAIATSGRATIVPQADGSRRLTMLQVYSVRALAADLHRQADGTYGYKLAPGATESDDERVSSLPSAGGVSGLIARSLLPGSVSTVRSTGSVIPASLGASGASPATLKELADAVATLPAEGRRVDIAHGKTADGTPRILMAALTDGQDRKSIWWFAPPNQPEGWFDDQGERLGGTALANPRPGARVSSPFGVRRYYGRRSGTGFHNGIDYEGKIGDPILAAADGVINYQGWYFNYGRTVKVSHADNFETLYAHMTQFVVGLGPGSRVRRGEVIGYVGSTGRSTGPHLHFSTIVNGQFVDPAPFVSERGGPLAGDSLVAFRQWQQDIRGSVNSRGSRGRSSDDQPSGMQPGDSWSTNPFQTRTFDRL